MKGVTRYSGALQRSAAMHIIPLTIVMAYTDIWSLPCVSTQTAESTWVVAISSAPWPSRYDHAAVVFDDRLWILGGAHSEGYTLNKLADVWHSPDGMNWAEATEDAGWCPRMLHGGAVFKKRIWVLGGYSDGPNLNDVWSSEDGVTWTRVVEHAPWSGRYGHGIAVFRKRLWVIGGDDFDDGYDDVWYSEDGAVWTQAEGSAPWSPRWGHAVAVFGDRLWILGGRCSVNTAPSYLNDVWSSSDGVNWTEVTASAGWRSRCMHASPVIDAKLCILGGSYGVNFPRENFYSLNDVWCSADGADWTQITDAAPWDARSGHETACFDGKIWLLGGCKFTYSGITTLNDVWYLPSDSAEGEGEGEGEPPTGPHTADQNGDWQVGLPELLRVIQFYNSGEFHCAENPDDTEDGYSPGPGANQACARHASDYVGGADWAISLTELLRLIQLYNTGGYHLCPGEGTPDGYCPGIG